MGDVLDLPAAAERCERLRADGGTLVLTNGCFDLLHVGHVRSLRAARALGDALLVAVNGDASVRALKGAGRPVVPAAERAEVLAALACVDGVTVFDEPTAAAVVRRLRPDIYVKGGDYAGRELPEARIVESYGGSVVLLPYVAAAGTSALLRRVRATAPSELEAVRR
jgi:rfaE bifunctional protein nucleotidyltransferase chain/domain